ncbi:uncharacterized protein FOMMEDRAFT_167528 [Fomitiporia mediterranea MF3/22]|uniref:uncharacterized protein n=1 Tax=Fomitiporia mediterranea (strain MF3/22) TaxID=694068 RepID=UPI0004407947|nr:uncharacterized protein FOMMEDRAFT_167528 [Fomitiporia mediterranea MF3/22]EJD04317.1 hypothetical protein FOMMEDRAFT_167528 [Fomitiporia mediterranea MF3/22]
MTPLSAFPLPLLLDHPPSGYGWEERSVSILSTSSACDVRIDERDRFLGRACCVICGLRGGYLLQHCYIVGQSERDFWLELKARRWIPPQANQYPRHEPRNGLLMCPNHRLSFENYGFFIRFYPNIRKFVFVNYSGSDYLQQFHGKTIALDTSDRYAPFPSLFIIHEMRVRGFHPFNPVSPDMSNDPPWQDWILSDGVLKDDISNDAANFFNREGPPHGNDNSVSSQTQLQFQPMAANTGGTSSGRHTLALNENVIADILAATRALPSWRACEMEGTDWSGTAAENIEKYVSTFDVQPKEEEEEKK